MIAPIRSIISGVASGSIKDAKIVQLAGEVERLTVENSKLLSELAVRDAKISDLETQVENLQPSERIEEEAEKVLNYIYDTSSIFSRKKVANGLGIAIEVTNHCVNVLLVREFIKVVGRASGVGDIMEITPSGMRYTQTYK
jgi:predicted nuclease with TOPRIM domain